MATLRRDLKYIIFYYLGLVLYSSCEEANFNNNSRVYQNEWVVRIEGGPEVSTLLALRSGYIHMGPVLGFENTYLWHKSKNPDQRKRGISHSLKILDLTSKIMWAEEQKVITRHKRDYIVLDDIESEKPLIREKRLPFAFNSDCHGQCPREIDKNKAKLNTLTIDESENVKIFNDELWDQEWYLQDTRSNRNLPKLDLNVLPLYRQGITGRGIRVAVLDDGLEYTHDDLRNNYDPEISYDVNNRDNDPIPRYEATGLNRHGTRCAGEIAMEADNKKCGVGVAFEASIGGIKMLDGVVNDRVEGEALGYKPELVDIYTASWGPADDGKSLEAPGRLASEALERGVKQGRKGKGSIYVWASGNGGSKSDDCGCDGYVGSIYTVAVGSASQTGRFPWYGERCSATLATTYSSGAYHDQMIVTTDLKNKCTIKHTGTSASAPLAAGILALALQANKELTWRDIQHLIVYTSEYSPLRDNLGWFKNSAGFWYNPRFGFGLMNAYSLVVAGYNWTTVPNKSIYKIRADSGYNSSLSYGSSRILKFHMNEGVSSEEDIDFLEHIQVDTNMKYSVRGSLQMHLTAPSGTKVEILNPRALDKSSDGFTKWKFMSVATWGENPHGVWLLEILDVTGPATNNGTLGDFTLILHGTKEIPQYRKNGARFYNDEYNRSRKMNDFNYLKNTSANELDTNSEKLDENQFSERDWILRLLLGRDRN
ncbi:neuroendocrine convertase 1-like [Leptopilina heterotoma]|uniref:neuroendocrine convertase 1-like n=1 Tax=Leptopilina heterotoma TaxID=63436 RepID=UPI001CA849D7|nr:neuroendocrine convertase 1-like [Leptopilina heterotoma]